MLKCKIFSATLAREREALGDRVTDFIREQEEVSRPFSAKIVERQVLLSSDSEFHCLVIILWYEGT